MQALREGRSVAMTADVPGGEARRAGLGVVMVARQSGRPILPVAIATSRYIAFNTWSRMTINLPWSDLGFAIGEPVHVPRDVDTADLERLPAGRRGSLERGHRSWPTSARARDPARATPGVAGVGAPSPACASRRTGA